VKRVCIISDSHVNAVAGGWDLVKSGHPDIEVTFFASGQKTMNSLEVSSGRLISNDALCVRRMRRSSDGLEAIEGNYDSYLIVGLEFGFNLTVDLCLLYRVEQDTVDQRIPISDDCFSCALEDDLRQSIAIETVVKLHEITKAPITVVPYPFRTRAGGAAAALRRFRQDEIKKLALNSAYRLSKEYDFRLFLQPEHTLMTPMSTNPIYSRVPGSQDGHMNGAYGKEILNILFDQSAIGIM
jgi:hypothetical protein